MTIFAKSNSEKEMNQHLDSNEKLLTKNTSICKWHFKLELKKQRKITNFLSYLRKLF